MSSITTPPLSETKWPDPEFVPAIDYDSIVVEDGKPVDNIYVEKQYRLLTDPLQNSWEGPGEGRTYGAWVNVGLFYKPTGQPLVPDCMLSLDIPTGQNIRERPHRSYFVWVMGKVPDVVIEIVSDKRGGEDDVKMAAYARYGVPFYIIYDPENILKKGVLRGFALNKGKYEPHDPKWLPEVNLGLMLWEGEFEKYPTTWLRWCDREGKVIPTGAERALEAKQQTAEAQQQAAEAHQQAAEAQQQAAEAQQQAAEAQQQAAEAQQQAAEAHEHAAELEAKAKRLEAQLRALGIEPQ